MTKENKYDVVILGGGAAGLFCAFETAKKGYKVVVLEKSNKVGKKILMSGGGRCNFTNRNVYPHNFLSKNKHFSKSALSRYTSQDFIALVESHDIEYEERKHGQLFCINSAKDIVNMLLDECNSANVEIITNATPSNVKFNRIDGQYSLNTDIKEKNNNSTLKITSSALVIATGALSVPTLGGSGYGYDLAKQFNLDVIDLHAGLVPFMFSDHLKSLCENLSGVSHAVSVTCNNITFTEDMLFTHRGLSGPAILQISNYWSLGDEISINLFPDFDIHQHILNCKKDTPKQKLKSTISSLLPRAFGEQLELLLWFELADLPLGEWSNNQIESVCKKLHAWNVKPSSTEGYRTAEVTLFGIDTKHISSKTMEVIGQKGLYFIGEVLDVTGHLGGYNFQWAWSSAYAAASDL
ncbi:NAD(P)/FAD-dependent oxidoreductase [Gammaproteobacteria bacterium]|nr:NAD(P)/FAD-dependent oxidoreductase [Gammaproteobacteria bacterium]